MRTYLKKPLLIFAVVWVLSVASAFFVGRQLASSSNAGNASTRIVKPDSGNNSVTIYEAEDVFSGTGGNDEYAEPDRDAAYVDPRTVVPSLQAAMKISDPVKRLRLITLAIEGLDSTNVREALALFQNQPGGGFDRVRDLNLLMYAWGTFDGSAALDYAVNEMSGRGSRFATYTAMSGWAANDPLDAVAWTVENDADSRTVLGLVSGWASTDLVGATDYVTGLPEGSDRSRAVGILVGDYLQEGPDFAVAWAESIPDGELKSAVVNSLSRQWASVDPQSSAQWIAGYAETDVGESAVPAAASQWARENPVDAAAWAISLPEGEAKERGLGAVVNRWANSDPNAAGEWLNSLPAEPSLDPAVDAFARRISDEDPLGALTWAESIIDPDLRTQSIQNVGQEWYRQDPEAAGQWVESSDLPAEVQSAIVNPPPEHRFDCRGFFGGGGFGRGQ